VRVVVCSVPKSGTYLVGELLKEMGFTDARLHLGSEASTNYQGSSLEDARLRPEEFAVYTPLPKLLESIPDGHYAVGHLGVEHAPLLAGFAVLFCCRDLRDVVVSFSRWTHRTGRWQYGDQTWRALPDGPARVLGFLEKEHERLHRTILPIAGWTDADVTRVRFEDLLGDAGSARQSELLEEIARRVGDARRAPELLPLLERATRAETLTRSEQRSSAAASWSDELECLFRRQGFAKVNRRLGYSDRGQLAALRSAILGRLGSKTGDPSWRR
jgi:hypothetical protein